MGIILIFTSITPVFAEEIQEETPKIEELQAIADKYHVEVYEVEEQTESIELSSVEEFEQLLAEMTSQGNNSIIDVEYPVSEVLLPQPRISKTVTESFPKSTIWGIPVRLNCTIIFDYAVFQGIPRVSEIKHVSSNLPGVSFLRWTQEYYGANVIEHTCLNVKVYGRYEATASIGGVTVGTKTDLLPYKLYISAHKYFQ